MKEHGRNFGENDWEAREKQQHRSKITLWEAVIILLYQRVELPLLGYYARHNTRDNTLLCSKVLRSVWTIASGRTNNRAIDYRFHAVCSTLFGQRNPYYAGCARHRPPHRFVPLTALFVHSVLPCVFPPLDALKDLGSLR